MDGNLFLENLTENSKLKTRSISPENPNGEKGMGGKMASQLGVGRKGRPFLWIKSGEKHTLAEIKGPGCIRHIWMTFHPDVNFLRGAIIRIYWDGLSYPSVECPIGDFFGIAHGRNVSYSSLLTAMVDGGMNSWIPMPFSDSAKIEIENDSPFEPNILFYQIDYTINDIVKNKRRLCCTFRRENPTTIGKDFAILEKVKGEGRFLGCVVGVRTLSEGCWYQGEVKIYLDSDKEFPTICGTGTEDYILTAFGVRQHNNIYQGAPLSRQDLISFYRWHVLDPIYFDDEIKVTIQQIGAVRDKGLYERSDDWSSAAFFYLREPKELPKIPSRRERLANIIERREGEPEITSRAPSKVLVNDYPWLKTLSDFKL